MFYITLSSVSFLLTQLTVTQICYVNSATILNNTTYNFTSIGTMWIIPIVFTSTCLPNTYLLNGTCTKCKEFLEQCSSDDSCCSQWTSLECSSNDLENTCQCSFGKYWNGEQCIETAVTDGSNNTILTAAQIALGTALLIAISALSALTCKICATRRNGNRMSPLDQSDATSINSVQRFVLSRLRDRPPRYDDNNTSVNGMPDKPPPYTEMDLPPVTTPTLRPSTLPTPTVPQTNLHRLLLRLNRRTTSEPSTSNSNQQENSNENNQLPITNTSNINQETSSNDNQIPSTSSASNNQYTESSTIVVSLETEGDGIDNPCFLHENSDRS